MSQIRNPVYSTAFFLHVFQIMDRLCCPGLPVQKPAVSDHRRGGQDPGRRLRGGDEEDHQASSQVRIY
jgi:hypothetical protein